jgi:hypothetical protein
MVVADSAAAQALNRNDNLVLQRNAVSTFQTILGKVLDEPRVKLRSGGFKITSGKADSVIFVCTEL